MKLKFKHKSRAAFLTAAICMALSSSVFAMPTGGVVEKGDVSGLSNGTVANGGTLNVNQNSVINWQAFNVMSDEALNFAMNGNSLLNRVVGGDASQILGQINATGGGSLYLVNPSGIVLGNGAVLNGSSIVLSTLNISTNDFMNAVNSGNQGLLLKNNNGQAGDININGNVNLEGVNHFLAAGGKIALADNVTLSKPFDATFAAAKEVTVGTGDLPVVNLSTQAGNDISFGKNVTINAPKDDSDVSDLYLMGNTINLNNAKMPLGNKGSLDVAAVNSYQNPSYQAPKAPEDDYMVDASNTVKMDGANIDAGYLQVYGGNISIDNSTLKQTSGNWGNDTINLAIKAANGTLAYDDNDNYLNGKGAVTNSTADNLLKINNSTISSEKTGVSLQGGKVDIQGNTTISEGQGGFDVIAENNSTETQDIMNAGNDVTIGDGVTFTASNGSDNIIAGNTVKIGKATLNANDDGAIDIIAANKVTNADGHQTVYDLNSSNAVEMNGTTADTNYLKVYGGKATLNDASLTTAKTNENEEPNETKTNNNLTVIAANGSLSFDDGENYKSGMNNTADNVLSLSNTKINGAEGVTLWSGKVDITNGSNIAANDKNTSLDIVAGKQITADNQTYKANDVKADANNTVTIQDSTISNPFNIFIAGGKTNLNGKTTVTGDNEIDIVAGNEIRNPEYGFSGLTTTAGNTVSIGDGVTENGNSDIYIAGNTVNLGASTLQPTGDSEVAVIAANSYQSDGTNPNTTTMSLDSSNAVTMNGTNASANYLKVYSGKATLDNANLQTSSVNDGEFNTNLRVIAANGSLTFDDNENYQGGMNNTADNTLTLKNSKIDGANGVELTAGKIDMDNASTIHADTDDVTVTAQDHNITTDTAKNITAANGNVTITPEPKEPTPEPTPEPEPNPDPTPVAPSEDLNKAVQQGNETMTKTLNEANDKSTAVQAQAEELNKSDVSDDQKMAQVAGYAQAIRNDDELSSSEQDALVKTVINTVEPSQQATVDTKNKQDQANQNDQAKAQTGNIQDADTAVIVIPDAHRAGVSQVTVDGQVVE